MIHRTLSVVSEMNWPRFLLSWLVSLPMIGGSVSMMGIFWPEHPEQYGLAVVWAALLMCLVFWSALPFVLLHNDWKRVRNAIGI